MLTCPQRVPKNVPKTELIGDDMAHLEQRGKAWRCVVRLADGKKISATRDTKLEAAAWGKQQEALVRTGALTSSSSVTVGDMLRAYSDEIASKTDSAKWNLLRINNFCKDKIAELKVDKVITHDINQWIERRRLEVMDSTANRELTLLSAAFTYAVKVRRWITVNPCRGAMRPPKTAPRNRPLLTEREIEALCHTTGYSKDSDLSTLTAKVGACFLLALETGMRSGEILRLRPVDYMRSARTVRVAAIEQGGRKSARSGRASIDPSRPVPLTERAIDLLDQLLASKPKDQPYIVGMNDSQRDALWRKCRDKAAVEDFTFHDTKHEAATRLAPYLDPLALSHAIGTKDIRIIRDTYYNNDASRSAALLPKQLSLSKNPA